MIDDTFADSMSSFGRFVYDQLIADSVTYGGIPVHSDDLKNLLDSTVDCIHCDAPIEGVIFGELKDKTEAIVAYPSWVRLTSWVCPDCGQVCSDSDYFDE